jgi:hypothetical protein
MKVLNLRCNDGHGFEGWFASEADYASQTERGLVECPLCGAKQVHKLPSAPRLNLSGAQAPTTPKGTAVAAGAGSPLPELLEQIQAMWLHTVREVVKNTEDVGERFPEEARKIHYGEAEARGIRGQASPEEQAALSEEGISVVALPIPDGLKGPTH